MTPTLLANHKIKNNILMTENNTYLKFDKTGKVVVGCSHDAINVVIPDGVTKIAEDAFAHCHSLTSVEIPNSVKKIEEWAFNDCTSLISIVIPNRVKIIEEFTFVGCISLNSVIIPNSITRR